MSRRQRLKTALPILVLGLGVVLFGFVSRNLGHWLAASDPVERVDVIVVASGEADRRIPTAIEHLERGLANRLWVLARADGPVLHEPETIAAYLKAEGVDRNRVRVFAEGTGDPLRDAHLVARRLLSERNIDRIAVVGATLDQARTKLVFSRTVQPEVRIWSDGAPYDANTWWRAERSATLIEAAKYLATLATLGPGPEVLPEKVTPGVPLRAFVGGALIAFAVGALGRRIAPRLGMVSVARLWRSHDRPTSILGGFAIVAGLGGGMLTGGNVRLGALGAVAGAGVVLISTVGLVDDIAGLGAIARLVWAAGAGAAAWLLGLRIVALTAEEPIADLVNAALTILWFVGVTLALNLLDNLDGVTAGVGAASSIAIAVAAALGGQFVVTAGASALAGACIGFLIHNVHPARLFMGDMGALALGFALAALALALTPHPTPPLSMAVPVMALGIPIFDVVLVTISRFREGRSPATGGTDHSSHRLLAAGLSPRQSAAFLWMGQLLLGAVAVFVSRSGHVVGYALVAATGACGVIALVVFLRLPVWAIPAALAGPAERSS
jgi:UDP-GlcNAc:undecaprenyl-phosphate GlcNAc-1-phosphate transferase